jgi:hypothetical protein
MSVKVKSFRYFCRVDLSKQPYKYDEISERLRIMSCSLKPWQISKTQVKCLDCGESKEFCDPFTTIGFIDRHRRQGCSRFEIFIL